MSKDRFSYRVFALRLTKEVKDKLNEARKKSGLSWNLFVRDLLHKTKDIDFSLAKEELEELEKLEKINNMNEQYKNLIEKIKEVLPKELEINKKFITQSDFQDGYNEAIDDCISSLPQVMEVIKGEIEEKLKDIDSATNPMWIRKQIIDLITL